MWMWKFYKDFDEQADQQPLWAEYFQMRMLTKEANQKTLYIVEENHGWWSEEERRPAHHQTILSTDDGFESEAEAIAAMNRQIAHFASKGFVHRLSFDPWAERHYRYEIISSNDYQSS